MDYAERLGETGDPEIAMVLARMDNPNTGSDSINDSMGVLRLSNIIPPTTGSGVPTSYIFQNTGLGRDQVVNSVTLLGMQKLVDSGQVSQGFADQQLKQIHPPLVDPKQREYLLKGKSKFHALEKKPISFQEEVTRYNPRFSAQDLRDSGGININYSPTYDNQPFGQENPITIAGRIPSERELAREIDILSQLVNPDSDDNSYETGNAFRGSSRVHFFWGSSKDSTPNENNSYPSWEKAT
jgi:hypothetical protein